MTGNLGKEPLSGFVPDYMLSDLEGARVRFEVNLRESPEHGANLIAENMDFED